jgi:hypothetical protein
LKVSATLSSFVQFSPQILALPEGFLARRDLLTPAFRLHRDERLDIYYMPTHYLNRSAAVTVVGISPGFAEMALAYREARAGLLAGLPAEEILNIAARIASFCGPMRANLVTMMDGIRLAPILGIDSCAALFAGAAGLLHSTALIRDAVFIEGRNYSGHNPPPLNHPLLSSACVGTLLSELDALPDSLIIPLGKGVSGVLESFISNGMLDPRRCLLGFPHPSGANAHRHAAYRRLEAEFAAKIERWFRGRS